MWLTIAAAALTLVIVEFDVFKARLPSFHSFFNAQNWLALALTLKVAGWATALNLLFGVGVGYAMARWRFPGRDVLDALLTLPMVMPPTVLGYYLLVVIGTHGVLGGWLYQHFGIRLIFTWQAAVIAATIVAFPLVFKSARAAFETVDPQLEDAARMLGIGEWEVDAQGNGSATLWEWK